MMTRFARSLGGARRASMSAMASAALLMLLVPRASAAKASAVVTLTPDNFKELVLDSQETWLVEFYAPWCGHCKALAPEWEAAAAKLDGIVRVGAIDADKHRNLGSKYGIRGFPTIKVFKGIGAKARRPTDYQGERTARAIVDYAKSVLPAFSAVIKSSGLGAFFADEPNLPHAVLFTDKSRTPPALKALSAKHFGQVALGEIRKAEFSKMDSSFVAAAAIETYPTLLVFPPGSSDPREAERFTSELKPAALAQIIERAALRPGVDSKSAEHGGDAAEESPASAQDADSSTADEQARIFAQPKAHETDVHEVRTSEELDRVCVNRMDGAICVLELRSGSANAEALDARLKEVRAKYRFDKLAFARVDLAMLTSDAAEAIKSALGVTVESGATSAVGAVCAVRPRKSRVATMPPADEAAPAHGGEEAQMAARYEAFLDRVVGGDARYHKFANPLPAFSVERLQEHVDADKASAPEQCSAEGDVDAGSCRADL
mmetsp:Transcript_13918/g.37353  ORF Transcript_13918/g.37353 Transcript_13918/m.37353 type:complete len:491 (+) Transcript_13918:158-1630(+)